MPVAIIFDAVGTLLFPDPPVGEAYARLGREFGSRLEEAEVARRFPLALREAAEQRRASLADPAATSEEQEWERWRAIVAAVFDDVPQAGGGLFFALWEHFARSEHWDLYDDVADALAEAAAAGYRLAIASNFDARLPPICRAHRPLRAVESVFVSSQVGFTKPDGRFFAAVERALQLPPEEFVLVGDDLAHDVRGAQAAGWRAVHLNRQAAGTGDDRITSLAELLPLLRVG